MFENAYTRFLEKGMQFGGFVNLDSVLLKNQIVEFLKKQEGINETTKNTLINKIKDADDTELKSVINKSYQNIKDSRVDMIASNAIGSGFNLGLWVSYKMQGYKKKMWVSQKDAVVRDDHFIADGQTVGIDEPFIVGGENMMYPDDPTASAEQVINCRCVLIGIKE
jgi:uncharacterized protein with gpF-like domain